MRPREFETAFGVELPNYYKQAALSGIGARDELCDLLLFETEHPLLDIGRVNQILHHVLQREPWPGFLVAFASNGGGDYFAFDFRTSPPTVIFIDADRSVDENLLAEDRLLFQSYEKWRDERLKSSLTRVV